MRDTSLLAAILHTLALKSRGGLLFTEGEPDIGKSLLFSLELAYALQDGGVRATPTPAQGCFTLRRLS